MAAREGLACPPEGSMPSHARASLVPAEDTFPSS